MIDKKRTHGAWDPDAGKMLFLAGSRCAINVVSDLPAHHQSERSAKIANDIVVNQRTINKLHSLRDFSRSGICASLDAEIAAYDSLFVDSGVFGLAMDYAKETGISHNVALRTPIKQIPGWAAFRDMYVDTIRHVHDRVWGYVELDLGGTAQKIETRTWLESIGLAPIPVWHPLGDGLEYGKHLMETYDRVCLGNIVKSDRDTRKVILQAMTFARQHTKVWIHALGLGPVDFVTAYNVNSIDAMSWMAAIQYSRRSGYSLTTPFQRDGRYYDEEVEGSAYWIAFSKLERQILSVERNWGNYEHAKHNYRNRGL
jgi:hypothetical protein